MACCKCCCGNVDCTEGQEGKCCCGGIYGECCQEGQYCCSGVCEPEPCADPCDDPCQWQPVWQNDGTWGGGWELVLGCNPGCSCGEPNVGSVGTEDSPSQEAPYETLCGECGLDGYWLPPQGPAITWEWDGTNWVQQPSGYDASVCDVAPYPNGGPMSPPFSGAFVGETTTTGCACGS